MRIRRLLEARRIVVWAVSLAIVLSLPSAWGGLQSEDYVFRDLVTTGDVVVPWRVNLFGDRRSIDAETIAGHNLVERGIGAQPWLSGDDFHVSFWRPLSSLTHILDYRVLSAWPWLMHLESVAWYAALVLAVGWLQRRLSATPAVAGLATVLYAIDDAHGQCVGWLANRNALIASFFGVLAVGLHDRWRRDGWRAGAVLGPLSLLASLLGSEFGVAAVGYLLAHALFVDRARPMDRLRAAVPWFVAVVGWATAYRLLGHGAHGTSLYLDPTIDPVAFVREAPARAAALLGGQLTGPPSDLWRDLHPGSVDGLVAIGVAACVLTGWVLSPAISREPTVRFWAAGALLAVLPASCALPEDRLLLLVGVGASVLVSTVLLSFVAGGAQPARSAPPRRAAKALAAVWIAAHLVVAPLALPYRTLSMRRYDERLSRLSASAFGRIEHMSQTLVVANAPDFYFGAMMVITRIARRQLIAHNTIELVGGLGEVEIEGVDQNAVEVRPKGGFFSRPFNRIYRGRDGGLSVGDVVRYGGVEVLITQATAAGDPLAAIFRFERALEDPRVKWVVLHEGSYHPLDPPKPGQTIVIGEH